MKGLVLAADKSGKLVEGPTRMNTAKDEIRSLLDRLPENCTLEDIQYHLYVIEKINHGLQVAEEQGTFSQEEAEIRLKKWLQE